MTAIRVLFSMNKLFSACLLMFFVALLAACGTPQPTNKRAPIVEYGVQGRTAAAGQKSAPSTPETVGMIYVVQKGDTLYSIAFQHGLDYREVAALNKLHDPAAIKIGQQLRLQVPVAEPVPPKQETQQAAAPVPARLGGIKSQPKVGRLIYSEQALAQAERMQEDSAPAPASEAPVAVAAKPKAMSLGKDEGDPEAQEWGMPTNGKVIAGFAESANRKGVDIAGKKGQAVVASASGKVVYSGSGLRGYGKLIIIKHNSVYLSAYAHNDRLLVKEGQNVSKGQKIAEMGSSDADQVKLHFEIRKLGKPVDPARYLPLMKS